MLPVSLKTLILSAVIVSMGANADPLKKLHVIELSSSVELPEWSVVTDGGVMSRKGKDVYFDLDSKLDRVALELKCGNKALTITVNLPNSLTVYTGNCLDVKKM